MRVAATAVRGQHAVTDVATHLGQPRVEVEPDAGAPDQPPADLSRPGSLRAPGDLAGCCRPALRLQQPRGRRATAIASSYSKPNSNPSGAITACASRNAGSSPVRAAGAAALSPMARRLRSCGQQVVGEGLVGRLEAGAHRSRRDRTSPGSSGGQDRGVRCRALLQTGVPRPGAAPGPDRLAAAGDERARGRCGAASRGTRSRPSCTCSGSTRTGRCRSLSAFLALVGIVLLAVGLVAAAQGPASCSMPARSLLVAGLLGAAAAAHHAAVQPGRLRLRRPGPRWSRAASTPTPTDRTRCRDKWRDQRRRRLAGHARRRTARCGCGSPARWSGVAGDHVVPAIFMFRLLSVARAAADRLGAAEAGPRPRRTGAARAVARASPTPSC